MNLQPKLKNTFMDMALMDAMGTKSFKRIDVELWEQVGLCIHVTNGEAWKISHYQSGRGVLKRLKDRSQAIEYLMVLRTVLSDWRHTYE